MAETDIAIRGAPAGGNKPAWSVVSNGTVPMLYFCFGRWG